MTNRLERTLTERFKNKRENQVYVFENREKLGPRNYSPKSFLAAVNRAGLTEKISFHGLRRTYASRLVQANVSSGAVAQLLGHRNSLMVEKHYGHLAPNQASKAAVDILNKMQGEE